MNLKERFRQHLSDKFGDTASIDDLVEYLYAKSAIDGIQVRKFLIRQTFEVKYTSEPVSATSTVEAVADQFGVTSEYVWQLVR